MLSIYPNNSNNPNFSGLTSQLKRRPYAKATEILEEVEKYSKSNGIAGSLPHSWIEKLPLANRKEKIKDIYTEFGKAMAVIEKGLDWQMLGWDYDIAKDSGMVIKPEQKNIDAAKEIITSVLEKHGIVSGEEKVGMENIEEGVYGSVQKLTVNGEEFSLKIFISFEKMLESLTKAYNGDKKKASQNRFLRHLLDCHGIYLETNRAQYLNARQNSRFNKVFFTDLTNGGMLSRLLDDSIPTPKNPTPLYYYGLSATGEELDHNSINKVVFDFGGIFYRPRPKYKVLAENNTARRIYTQFSHTPKEKRQSRFNAFSKQYQQREISLVDKLKILLHLKKDERWINNLKKLLQTDFNLH